MDKWYGDGFFFKKTSDSSYYLTDWLLITVNYQQRFLAVTFFVSNKTADQAYTHVHGHAEYYVIVGKPNHVHCGYSMFLVQSLHNIMWLLYRLDYNIIVYIIVASPFTQTKAG